MLPGKGRDDGDGDKRRKPKKPVSPDSKPLGKKTTDQKVTETKRKDSSSWSPARKDTASTPSKGTPVPGRAPTKPALVGASGTYKGTGSAVTMPKDPPGPRRAETCPILSTGRARHPDIEGSEALPASIPGTLPGNRGRFNQVAEVRYSSRSRTPSQRAESPQSDTASIHSGRMRPDSRPATPESGFGPARSATMPLPNREATGSFTAPSRGALHRRSTAVRHAGSSLTEAGKAPLRPSEIASRPSSVKSTASASSIGKASLASVKTERFGPEVRTTGGGVRYEDTKLEVDGEILERDVNDVPKSKWKTLMLLENQGGTFGFGDKYVLEDGRELSVRESADARVIDTKTGKPFKVKHLSFYGEGIELIGTKGCLSCLGVYFEIKGNRVFCAHFNVWHANAKRADFDFTKPEENPFEVGTPDYNEVVWQVDAKMKQHCKEHGWEPRDVFRNTVRFVCPQREYAGRAVAAGIESFLGNDEPDYRLIKRAHGFAIAPGTGDVNTSKGKLFLWVRWDDRITRMRVPIFEDYPAEIDECLVIEHASEPQPKGTFYYETGFEGEWPEVEVTSQWINDHVEDFTPRVNLNTAIAHGSFW